jgi:hypothetical protein
MNPKLKPKVYILIVLLLPSECLKIRSDIEGRNSLQTYCSSFKSCNECKRSTFQCEWCNQVGCTAYPRLHCPKRVLLDEIWKKNTAERYCTEIVNKQPIFVPANLRRFIKLELKIDDLTLYESSIMCEMQIGHRVTQVTATLEGGAAYCDTAILKTNRNMVLGYIRLVWGGVEPFSNSILVLVYNCHTLAKNCIDCLALNKEYDCGWCKENNSCGPIEECPRQFGLWMNKSFSCINYQSFNYQNEMKKRYFQ